MECGGGIQEEVNPDSRLVTSLSDTSGEERSLPDADEIEARPAQTSEKPADFANASPFPNRRKEKDMVATVILAAAAVAILAFLVSMLGLLQIHGPQCEGLWPVVRRLGSLFFSATVQRCKGVCHLQKRRRFRQAHRAPAASRKLRASSRFARRLPDESVTRGRWQKSGGASSSAR